MFGFALGAYLTIVLAFRIVSTLIPVRRGLPPVKSSRVSLLGRRLVYQIYPCFPRPGLLTTALPSANDRVDALALFHVEACETRLSVVGSCFVDRFIHVRMLIQKGLGCLGPELSCGYSRLTPEHVRGRMSKQTTTFTICIVVRCKCENGQTFTKQD